MWCINQINQKYHCTMYALTPFLNDIICPWKWDDSEQQRQQQQKNDLKYEQFRNGCDYLHHNTKWFEIGWLILLLLEWKYLSFQFFIQMKRFECGGTISSHRTKTHNNILHMDSVHQPNWTNFNYSIYNLRDIDCFGCNVSVWETL